MVTANPATADFECDIRYSAGVYGSQAATWAKPLRGGPVRCLFVPSVKFGREFMELAQRMDVSWTAVTVDGAWDLNKWGIGDFYGARGDAGDFALVHRNLERALTGGEHYDVIVLPGINGWSRFPTRALQALETRVRNGAGLVMIQPFHGCGSERCETLDRLSPLVPLYGEGLNAAGYLAPDWAGLRTAPWIPASHYITAGIPFEKLPWVDWAFYPYEVNGEAIVWTPDGDPIAAVRRVGAGRVVAFGYYPRDLLPQHKNYTGKESTYDPVSEEWEGNPDAVHGSAGAAVDALYALLARSVIWAAGRSPETGIGTVICADGELDCKAPNNMKGRYRLRLRNGDGEAVFDEEVPGVPCQLPAWSRGAPMFADLFLVDLDGATVDWATSATWGTAEEAGLIRSVEAIAETVEPGEEVSAEIDLSAADPTGTVTVELSDAFGEVWARSELKPECPGKRHVALRVPENINSRYMIVQASWRRETAVLQRTTSLRVAVSVRSRVIRDFEVLMCPQNRGRSDWLPLVARLNEDAGVTGLYPGSPLVTAMSGIEGMGVYWYNRRPYLDAKETYVRLKDKRALVRQPCLNDPTFLAELLDRMNETVSRYRRYSPIAYFANDEGSLTCYTDELELCFCDWCLDGMRTWLKRRYYTLRRLNAAWRTKFSRWSDVSPDTAEEARVRGWYASWADHRTFMEWTFVGTYRRLAEAVRSIDPEGALRMSGCQSPTAYSGYHYGELYKCIGVFEAYPSGNQYEIHRSFADSGQIAGGWFGYGAIGSAARRQIWEALLHGLTIVSLFWEYAMINPDFTHSRSAQDYGTVLKEIRRNGYGKLLLHTAKRETTGIAVHYSMHSVRAAEILGDSSLHEANLDGWLRVLEALGYQYVFRSSEQIEQGALTDEGFRVLVLPHALALTDGEKEQIAAFVRTGGVMLADFQAGIMDEICRYRGQGALDEVLGIERLSQGHYPFYNNGSMIPGPVAAYTKDDGFERKAGEKATNDATDSGIANSMLDRIADAMRQAAPPEGCGLLVRESGVRAAGGASLLVNDFMPSIPAVVQNRYGAGAAWFLNLSLERCGEGGRYPEAQAAIRKLLAPILAAFAVKPAELSGEADAESVYYRDGQAVYLALLPAARGTGVPGRDGLRTGLGAESREKLPNELFTVTLRGKAHVYDMRSGAEIGWTDRFSGEYAEGEAALYGLLPGRFTGFAATFPDTVSPGGTAELTLRLHAPEPRYRHVFACQWFDADGRYLHRRSRNVTMEGEGEAPLRLTWQIPYGEKTEGGELVIRHSPTGATVRLPFKALAAETE